MVRKVSEILKENDVARKLYESEQQDTYKQPGLVKTALAGLTSGLVSSAPSALGFVSSLPELGYHGLRGLFNDEYNTKDKVLETLADSKLMQLGGYLDDKIKSKFGIDDITKLDKMHQIALMAGDFAPLIASGGSYGAIKVGQKATNKIVKNTLKKAAAKGLNKETRKKLAKRNAFLTDTAMGFAIPGVQVSKDAGKLGKLFQIGTQTGLPIGMNEYIQKQNNNVGLFGDYREPNDDEVDREKITLIKDKRKFKGKDEIPENLMDNIVEYEIDPSIKEEESNTLRNFLVGTAAIGAAVTGTARYTNAGKKLVNDVLKSAATNKYDYNSLPMKDKVYMTASNKMGFMDKQIKDGQVLAEDRNRLYMDKKVFTQNAWDRGEIGDVVEMNVSPNATKLKIQALKDINPELYDQFEDFLELTRQIQHESNAYNTLNDINLSTVDYMQTMPNRTISLEGLYKNYTNYDVEKRLYQVYNNLVKNPNVKEIFNDLNEINTKLLDYKLKRGIISEDTYNKTIKNRTMFNQLLYKPGIEDMGEQGFIKRLTNSLFNSPLKSDNSLSYIENLTPRGAQNSVARAAKFLDVFENSFKQGIIDVEKNYNIKQYLTNSNELITKTVNQSIKKFKDEVEDAFIKRRNELEEKIIEAKGKSAADYEKYHKQLMETYKEFYKELESTSNDLKHMLNIRKLGEQSIYDVNKVTLDTIHNTAEDIITENSFLRNRLFNHFNKAKPTKLEPNAKSNLREGVISYIDGDKQVYYKMDPHFAKAMLYDPKIVNSFCKALFASKNFLQSTITGKYAPWFAPRANIMTMNEAMLAASKIGQNLNLNNINIRGYTKEMAKNYKAMHSKYISEQMAKDLQTKIAKINSQSDISVNDTIQIEAYQKQLDTILNSEVSEQEDLINKLFRAGTVSNKPINVTDEISYTLNGNTKFTAPIKQQLEKLYGFHNAEKLGNFFNMYVDLLRENPSLSLTTYLAKEVKRQRGLKELNQDVLNEIAQAINTNVANNVLRGSGEGFVGGLSEIIRNYTPYGNILINSITPKIKASGISKGMKNLGKLGKDLLDADVRYIDVLKEMQDIAKQVGSNKYMEALFFVSFIPATLQYVWNHMNQDNINSYYNYSNYNKASRLIFTNMLGKGKHITIPLDQEVALSNTMVYAFWDNVLGMSKYNQNDPAFNKNLVMLEALGRSIGLDFQPAKVLANLSGYNFSINPFEDRRGVNKLPNDVINDNMTETAYENGIANQQITALTNSLFGQLGSAFLSAAEEGKVGARSGTFFGDLVSSFLDKTVGTIGLVQTDNTRNMALTSDTIQDVYKKRETLKKIASIKTKNPQQQAVYDLIKMYNRNRIQPVKDQISNLRKEMVHIKANTKTSDGKTQSYYSRKANLNELTQQLQKLYKLEYEEYNKLDNLIQQLYGNGITIESFMNKLYTGE